MNPNKKELRHNSNNSSDIDFKLCHQIIHYDSGITYYKMSISEKIKTINNKIKQSKAQYNLDRQTAKISALSSGNVNE